MPTHLQGDETGNKVALILTKKTGSHNFIKLFVGVEVDVSPTKYALTHWKSSSKDYTLSTYAWTRGKEKGKKKKKDKLNQIKKKKGISQIQSWDRIGWGGQRKIE